MMPCHDGVDETPELYARYATGTISAPFYEDECDFLFRPVSHLSGKQPRSAISLLSLRVNDDVGVANILIDDLS